MAIFQRGCLLLLGLVALTGCQKQTSTTIDYPMGEKVAVGPLTYTVIETAWSTQLGELFRVRVPQQRFLMISLSVTNGGGSEVSLPLLQLENQNGQTFLESDNGEGVDNWFGLLRNINPAQTQQGRLLFDVALTSYRLRLTDASAPGSERYAWVAIPLRMDTETEIQSPLPGSGIK
jgi:hypothetical protein